jgi:rod shape-determining protein MreC
MPKTPKTTRNRIIVICIILLCVTMVTLYVREGDTGPLHKVQNFFLDLVSPLSNGFSKIFRPIKEGFVNLFHLPSLSKQKKELEKEVASLRRQMQEMSEKDAEVTELKRLLKWTEDNTEQPVGADIIGQSPDNWQRLMIINKGSSQGLKKYMSVITDEGLVGRLISVGSHSSVVQLITDSRSAIGARDVRNRETGILEGNNTDNLRFTPMNEEADVKVGDIIETSGMGGTVPSGKIIGKVTEVKKRAKGLTRLMQITPYVSFSKLDKVVVLVTPEPESIILKEPQ